MSDVRSLEPKPARRNWRLRLLLSLSVVAILWVGTTWYKNRSVTALEASAQQYIRLNGSTSEGYRHNWVSTLLSFLPLSSNGRPIATQPIAGVSFPRDRLNDYMASELLNIRNLESIVLYPPDPHRNGIDYGAKSISTVASLRDVDTPLSEDSIQALEERFPKLMVQLVDRAVREMQNDVTK